MSKPIKTPAEKRRHVRYPTQKVEGLRCKVRRSAVDKGDDAHIINVSDEGVGFIATDTLKSSAHCQLSFEFNWPEASSASFNLQGEIVRVDHDGVPAGFLYYGVKLSTDPVWEQFRKFILVRLDYLWRRNKL